MSAKHRGLAWLVPHQDAQDRASEGPTFNGFSLWRVCCQEGNDSGGGDNSFLVLTDFGKLPDVAKGYQQTSSGSHRLCQIDSITRVEDCHGEWNPAFLKGQSLASQTSPELGSNLAGTLAHLMLYRKSQWEAWRGAEAENDSLRTKLEESKACGECVAEPPFEDEEIRSEFDYPPRSEILPSWFIDRMTSDAWSFGLLLTTGSVLVVETISRVIQDAFGNTWIDVQLRNDGMVGNGQALGGPLVYAPTSRRDASINLAHVVAAFELADT